MLATTLAKQIAAGQSALVDLAGRPTSRMPTILSAGTLSRLDKLADSGCGIDYLEEFAAYFSRLREYGKGKEAAWECPHGPVYPCVSGLKLVVDWVLYSACA